MTTLQKTSWEQHGNRDFYTWVHDDASINFLEKQQNGRVSKEDIAGALDEYNRLFRAGLATQAEIMTLHRAFPDSPKYAEAASKFEATEPMVVGGPASVEIIDREGHMVTTEAMEKAFTKYMANFRTRNTMVLHSDVQVGWALPAYINKGGQIFKSGVDGKGLFFICELRDDTRIAEKVREQVNEGRLKSYSIAGSATKVQNMQKGLMPYMQVDDMELAEVTICEKGVNQGAGFDLLKSGSGRPTQSCIDGSCLLPEGDIIMVDGDIDFKKSFDKWLSLNQPVTEWDHSEVQSETEQGIVKGKEDKDVDRKVYSAEYEALHPGTGAKIEKSIDIFTNILKKQKAHDPFKAGHGDTTLNNYEGRVAEHHQLLREYGFPSEQPIESVRYTPVIEVETDEIGLPINNKPPWQVNEAGQHLGAKHDDDLPTFKHSDRGKAKAKSISKEFYSFMDMNVNNVEVPAEFMDQPYVQPYDGTKTTAITSWIKQPMRESDEGKSE